MGGCACRLRVEDTAKRRNLEESSLNFAAVGSFSLRLSDCASRNSDNVASTWVAGFFFCLIIHLLSLLGRTLFVSFFLALFATIQPLVLVLVMVVQCDGAAIKLCYEL